MTIKLVLRLGIYGSAIAVGFGLISWGWLLGTVIGSYLLSIFEESKGTPGGDFRALETNEFTAADHNIKKRFAVKLAYVGIVFGASWVASLIVPLIIETVN